ncbi:MAG: hypothetical protein WC897_02165 [Candidatus Gracilibacteria bacterium]
MGFLSLFRRKRRTGNSNFSSYRMVSSRTRKPFNPKPTKQARSKERTGLFAKALRILKLILILALILGGIYILFLTNTFEIQKVDVEGGEDTLEEQTALNTKLQEYLGENLFLVKSSILEESLIKEYPYLKTISVNKIPLHTLKITLETYTKIANIRIDLEDGSNKYFVINEKGYIVGTEAIESLPLIIMDVNGSSIDLQNGPTINEELIAKDTLETLLATAKNFEDKFDMQILEIHYRKQAREIHLYTERYFYIWLDLTGDIDTQLIKLKKSLSVINIYEANLEYVDLRISGQNGEKVIYMLRE